MGNPWHKHRLARFEAKINDDRKTVTKLTHLAAFIEVDDFHDAVTNGKAAATSLRAAAARLDGLAFRYDRLGAAERDAGKQKAWRSSVSEAARDEASFARTLAEAATTGDTVKVHGVIVQRRKEQTP